MGVDRSIANSANKIKAIGEEGMNASNGVMKTLRKSKVYEIYCVVDPHHEVVRLDVTMNIVATMEGFQNM